MKQIVEQFQLKSEPGDIRPLKIGFINDSFIVESKEPDGEWYFLQRINHNIFKNVDGLQKNISQVTDHLRKVVAHRLGV